MNSTLRDRVASKTGAAEKVLAQTNQQVLSSRSIIQPSMGRQWDKGFSKDWDKGWDKDGSV